MAFTRKGKQREQLMKQLQPKFKNMIGTGTTFERLKLMDQLAKKVEEAERAGVTVNKEQLTEYATAFWTTQNGLKKRINTLEGEITAKAEGERALKQQLTGYVNEVSNRLQTLGVTMKLPDTSAMNSRQLGELHANLLTRVGQARAGIDQEVRERVEEAKRKGIRPVPQLKSTAQMTDAELARFKREWEVSATAADQAVQEVQAKQLALKQINDYATKMGAEMPLALQNLSAAELMVKLDAARSQYDAFMQKPKQVRQLQLKIFKAKQAGVPEESREMRALEQQLEVAKKRTGAGKAIRERERAKKVAEKEKEVLKQLDEIRSKDKRLAELEQRVWQKEKLNAKEQNELKELQNEKNEKISKITDIRQKEREGTPLTVDEINFKENYEKEESIERRYVLPGLMWSVPKKLGRAIDIDAQAKRLRNEINELRMGRGPILTAKEWETLDTLRRKEEIGEDLTINQVQIMATIENKIKSSNIKDEINKRKEELDKLAKMPRKKK